jgi:protein-tyrosine-phosphatase
MNQARSPFAQAVLEANFPDDQITSTGVSAYLGTPILDSVVTIAKSWGVPITKLSSTAKEDDLTAILSADLVITADNEQGEIIRNLGYLGDLRSYEEIISDKDFIPIDPEGLSTDAMARELGKVGALTLRAAIDQKGFVHTPLLAAARSPEGRQDILLPTRRLFEIPSFLRACQKFPHIWEKHLSRTTADPPRSGKKY